MYAVTHPYTIDENGNRKYVYCHWGVVDENKKFIPGKRYVLASLEERERLIFPDDWDMSEAKRLSGAWSEEGKTGRLLILHKQFSSTPEVLDEMRSKRCVEHTGKAKHITMF